jgi:hypothetical protein
MRLYSLMSLVAWGVDQPFRKERWPQMGGWNTGPVKDTFRDPMILRRMALRIPPGGDLRHVNDGADPSFLGSLGEVGRGIDDTRTYRIDKIGRPDAFQRSANAVDIGKISYGNLDTTRSQCCCSRIIRMDERSYLQPELQRCIHGSSPGKSRCTCHKNTICTHWNLNSNRSICSLQK